MNKLITALLILILACGTWGCAPTPKDSNNINNPVQGSTIDSPNPSPSNQLDPDASGQSREALGGIRLGMTAAEVEKVLGQVFTEKLRAEVGPFGENWTVRSYGSGCDLVIGQTTGKVLQIDVFSSAFPTAQGAKVGDVSIPVLNRYRQLYPEFIGNQSPDKLAGWFVTESGVLLIFSSMENRDRSNLNLTPDSKIHAITLGYSKYFD